MQKNKIILPPKTIGIIGGGQLGRMMAIAAKYMGYQICVLDPTPNCPAAQVADQQITAAYDDREAIKELAEVSDVVTYEFENVDLTQATYIEEKGKLPQGARALEVSQNREKEKNIIRDLGLPVPKFEIVTNAEECRKALRSFDFPAVIKTCRGGYDGKGQIKLTSEDQIEVAADFAEQHQHCIIEQWIAFDAEISVVFTRSLDGSMTFFPVSENDHRDHILYQTTVPAHVSDGVKEKAIEAARKVADHLSIVGTFAIEMFVRGEEIYLNEMAPRPHNSGHYSIEACNISQFTQHVRAVCGLPLVEIELLQPAIMINILGEDLDDVLNALPQIKNGFVHLYGKTEAKEKRKMGHVTFIGETHEAIYEQIEAFEKTSRNE